MKLNILGFHQIILSLLLVTGSSGYSNLLTLFSMPQLQSIPSISNMGLQQLPPAGVPSTPTMGAPTIPTIGVPATPSLPSGTPSPNAPGTGTGTGMGTETATGPGTERSTGIGTETLTSPVGVPLPGSAIPPTNPLGLNIPPSVGTGVTRVVSLVKNINFTNGSTFGSSSSGNSFSTKEVSSKSGQLDDTGKLVEKNFNMSEFVEKKNAEGTNLEDKLEFKNFTNGTTTMEDKVKTQDGNFSEQTVKNTGNEASGVETVSIAVTEKTGSAEPTKNSRKRRELSKISATLNLPSNGGYSGVHNDIDDENDEEVKTGTEKSKTKYKSTNKITKLPTTTDEIPKTSLDVLTPPIGKIPETSKVTSEEMPGCMNASDGSGDDEVVDSHDVMMMKPTKIKKPDIPKTLKKANPKVVEPHKDFEVESDPSSFTFKNEDECREAFGEGKKCTMDQWESCRQKKCLRKNKEPVYCMKSGHSIYKCHLDCMRGHCEEDSDGLNASKLTEPQSKIEKKGKCSKKRE